MKLNFFLYLHLQEQDVLLNLAEDAVQLEQLLEDLSNLIAFLQTDKDVAVFFDSRDVSGALNHLKELHDDQSRLTNPTTALRLLLRDYPDVQDESQVDHQSSYFSWHYQESRVHPENVSILAEIAERSLASAGAAKFLALTLGDTNHSNAPIIPVFKDSNQDAQLPKFVLIEYVYGLAQAFNWLNKNRRPRKFIKNPKHGENGLGVRYNKGEKVSPLRCSEAEAHVLLQTAIGDNKTAKLYNFDVAHSQYMEFPFENETPENIYHGYHLDNEAEVPNSVRAWIEKIRLVTLSLE